MTPTVTPKSMQELEEAFIKVSFEEDTPGPTLELGTTDPLYKPWGEQCELFALCISSRASFSP